MDRALKRIRELMPKRRTAAKPDSFFYKFESGLEADPARQKLLNDIETDLACLDDVAWAALKAQATKYLVCNRINGWVT